MIQTAIRHRSNPLRPGVISSPTLDPTVHTKPTATRGSRPTRVLIVESNQDGTVGGSYQVLFDLATRVDRSRFEPIVLFYQNNAFVERLRARGVEVVLFDDIVGGERETIRSGRSVSKVIALTKAVLRRRRELRRLRIDLLHMNNSPGVGSDDWLPAARLAGIPCVASSMGDAGSQRRLIHRWLYRCYDLYLPVSQHMAGVLRRHGVNTKRIVMVYQGVDFDALRARVTRSREAVRAELGVSPGQLLVLMAGNIRGWKGQREVIAALRLLPERVRTRLRVCFAGATASMDSEYEAQLREEIAAGGLEQCVSLLGFRDDVPDLYNAADIALHASTTPEPFGLVVPEAMALKCAVIAASSGGPAEIITPGTGVLCNPSRPEEFARALDQLVSDDSLREAIATAAPARAAAFSFDRTLDGTQRVYDRALGRSSGEKTV